jgi:hypothetical protein
MPFIEAHPLNSHMSNLIDGLKEQKKNDPSLAVDEVIRSLEKLEARGIRLKTNESNDNPPSPLKGKQS